MGDTDRTPLTTPQWMQDEVAEREAAQEAERKQHFLFRRIGEPRSGGTAGRDILGDFIEGRVNKGRSAPVPGGRRLHTAHAVDEPGAIDLFSYQTVIARRHKEGDISTTPRRYSPTTTKWQNRLMAMIGTTHEPSGESRKITAKVPGRHGGFGIPWHATGWETLPFIHHRRK